MSVWQHTDHRFAQVDPELVAVSEAKGKLAGPTPDPLEPKKLRAALLQNVKPGTESLKNVTDRTVPGPNGDIPIRIFVPETSKAGPLPCLVYFHGGCWFLNNLDSHDPFMRRLANTGQFIVVGVDYRLAPDHPFPQGLEDCYAATKWVCENASEIGGDGAKVAVGGDSCGGNLSAAVSIFCKERGGPPLAMQLLLYPMTDHYTKEDKHQTLKTMAKLPTYTRPINDLGWDIYGAASSPHGSPDKPNYHAAVLQAPDLTGLAPAHVVLAQCDIVYDEGLAYAKRLQEAGNKITIKDYPACVHGFMAYSVAAPNFGLEVKCGPPAIAETVAALNKAFGEHS